VSGTAAQDRDCGWTSIRTVGVRGLVGFVNQSRKAVLVRQSAQNAQTMDVQRKPRAFGGNTVFKVSAPCLERVGLGIKGGGESR
jgi:hypothetical protein